MNKIAVFPGSFDPITVGHVDILLRSKDLFDKIYVAIGINNSKKYLFSLEQREAWLKETFKEYPTIEVATYTGLTTKYCEEVNANYIIRGIRSAGDFEYEKTIAHLNSTMLPGVETLLILSKPQYSSISSTIVREIIRADGDASLFLPDAVAKTLQKL